MPKTPAATATAAATAPVAPVAASKEKKVAEKKEKVVAEKKEKVATEKKEKVSKDKAASASEVAAASGSASSASTSEIAAAADAVVADAAASADAAAEDFAAVSASFVSNIQKASALVSSLKSEFRTLEKLYTRQLKVAQKNQMKRKRKTDGRPPSGFIEPVAITNELADFLGKEHGAQMSRNEVTKALYAYILENNLRNPDNQRIILPDAKLRALLKVDESITLTYFNFQKYMTTVFPKKEKKEKSA